MPTVTCIPFHGYVRMKRYPGGTLSLCLECAFVDTKLAHIHKNINPYKRERNLSILPPTFWCPNQMWFVIIKIVINSTEICLLSKIGLDLTSFSSVLCFRYTGWFKKIVKGSCINIFNIFWTLRPEILYRATSKLYNLIHQVRQT